MSGAALTSNDLLSVVVPAFNEEEVLHEFHKRLTAALNSIALGKEIIYVNDGSTDRTLSVMEDLQDIDPTVAIINLSRNYGKEIALTAGLDHANGDAAIVIDADLQDPPEMIQELVEKWNNGYDVVYAKRTSREGESVAKRLTAHWFYRLLRQFSSTRIPEDTGDFRIISRRALDSIKQIREHHRYMKGLFSWIGFSQLSVSYHRDRRYAGRSKWSYWHLWNFALEGITSFTTAPLRISTYLGLFCAAGAFLGAIIVIFKTIAFGDPVKGWPSLMVVILFIGGIQLIGIGIIGEYLGRMFIETKQRPLYFVQDYHPAESESCKITSEIAFN